MIKSKLKRQQDMLNQDLMDPSAFIRSTPKILPKVYFEAIVLYIYQGTQLY